MALDQSLRATGWAIGAPCCRKPVWGLFELPSWHEREGERQAAFEDWLRHMIKSHAITHVYFEAPVGYDKWQKSFDTTMNQGAQNGAIDTISFRCGVDAFKTDVNAMRARFIGHTKPPPGLVLNGSGREWLKQKAIEECASRGWFTYDHNEAEALGHLDYALSMLSKRHASQSDVLFRRIELNNSVKRFRGELA